MKTKSKTSPTTLSIREIERRFKSEWVLVQDPRTDEQMRVLGGKVLCHSKDRDEVYRYAIKVRPKRFAMLYLGRTRSRMGVLAHSLPPSARIDGLLGLDFLRSRRLTIDFSAGTLELR